MHGYAAACLAAATNQGLDPLTDALTLAEIPHTVAQTGGFCMVVTVPRTEGTWAVINDGPWLVGWYVGNTWLDWEGDPEPVEYELSNLDEVVSLVKTSN